MAYNPKLFYHFSDRQSPPSYRDEAEFGSTPRGVYFYPGWHVPEGHFGTARARVFVAKALVPILNLRNYTESQFKSDVAKLKALVGTKQINDILRRWEKHKSQFPSHPASAFWYVISKTVDPGDSGLASIGLDMDDPDDRPTWGDQRTEDPVLANRLLRKLGYRAIVDPGMGLIYSGEPVQAFFTDDRAFEIVDSSVRKNPSTNIREKKALRIKLARAVNALDEAYYVARKLHLEDSVLRAILKTHEKAEELELLAIDNLEKL